MAKRKEQPTLEDCRKAYWTCIERYEEKRTDAYSTWTQIQEAADAVATARNIWIARCEAVDKNTPKHLRRAVAQRTFCAATGEDLEWVRQFARKGSN